MNQKDLKLNLLRGTKAKVRLGEEIYFTPVDLDFIVDYGYEQFMKDINVFFLDLNKLKLNFNSSGDMEEFTPFQIFLWLLKKGEDELVSEWKKNILSFLKILTKKDWEYKNAFFFCGDFVLTEDIWFLIRKVLAEELGVKLELEDDYNFANERAKQFKEKRKAAEEEVQRIKSKKESESDFFDLVSGVASRANSLNIVNIWELSMFQFTQEMKRLNLSETYDFNLRAIIAGADSKKIKVQHWTTKI